MSKTRRRPAEKADSRQAAAGEISPKRIAIALGAGLTVLLAAALLLAVLTAFEVLPPGHVGAYAGLSVFLGGLTGSLIAGGSRHKLLAALLTAAGLLGLLLLIGALFFHALFLTKSFLMVLIILLVSCMIGSMISTALR